MGSMVLKVLPCSKVLEIQLPDLILGANGQSEAGKSWSQRALGSHPSQAPPQLLQALGESGRPAPS